LFKIFENVTQCQVYPEHMFKWLHEETGL